MGVDLSVAQVVGVILDQDGIDALRATFNDDEQDNYWAEGILEWVDAQYEFYTAGIQHGSAGSYYSSDPITEYLYFDRLSTHFSGYELPGGIMTGPKEFDLVPPSSGEHNQIVRIAQVLGTPHPVVQSFTAVLWH